MSGTPSPYIDAMQALARLAADILPGGRFVLLVAEPPQSPAFGRPARADLHFIGNTSKEDMTAICRAFLHQAEGDQEGQGSQ